MANTPGPWNDYTASTADSSGNGDAPWRDYGGKDESPGLVARVKQGASRAIDSARTALTDDPNKIAQIASDQARTALPQTETQRKMAEEIAPYVDAANKAQGVVDNVKTWGAAGIKRAGQLLSNPGEAGKMIAEQLPNSLPGMAGGIAGAKLGAMAGSAVAPVIGTLVGGVLGGVAGGFAGGYGLEKGAAMQEQVQKEAQAQQIDLQDQPAVAKMVALKQPEFDAAAQRKGVGTAGTDALLNVATMGLAGVGGRTLAKEARTLADAVKAGTISAADAGTTLAQLEAKNAARNTLGAKALRGTGVVGAEMAGEGLSEAAGQKLAYGKVDAGDVIDEALLGLGTGGAMALGSKAFNKAAGIVDQDGTTRDIAAARDGLGALEGEESTDSQAPTTAPMPAPILDESVLEAAGVRPPAYINTRNMDRMLGEPPMAQEADAEAASPEPDTRTPSERMGINPAAGPLSRVAAVAVDSGASPVQFLGATGRDPQARATGPGVTNESNVIDVQGRVIEDRAIATPRSLADDRGMAAEAIGGPGNPPAAPAATPALPAPRNLREVQARVRAQKQEAANAQAAAQRATPATQALPGPGAVESDSTRTAGVAADFSTAQGSTNGPQADQAQQAVPQPAQAGAAPAAEPAASVTQQAPAGTPEVRALTDGAQASDTGAQAAPAAGPQGQAAAPAPTRLGRNNTPLNEGGKPFKTRKAAGDAKKLQPTMRVVTVPGGYALAEKTPAQLAAEERASRRLRNPNTSARGEPIPAHAFIVAAGGLNRVAASDMGVDGNPRIGNRTLFAGQGRGLSMDQATQMLIQDGYLSEGATINDALSLIKTSLTRPQYNADGIERIAQAESDAQFEDYLAAQEEAAADGDTDPFGMADEFTAEELDEVGYTDADPALQAEVSALIAQAEAMDIDTYAILEDIARTYANATQDQYNAAARDALAAAIARGNQDGGSAAAQAAPAPEPATKQGLNQPEAPANQAQAATENVAPEALELTALSPVEAAAQQSAQEQAAKAEAAAKRAEDAAAKAEEERKRIAQASVRAADTFELGQDPMDSLTGQGGLMFSRTAAGMSPEQAVAMLNTESPVLSADQRSAQRRRSDERLVATQMLVDGLVENWARAPQIIVARNMQDPQVPQIARDYDATLKSQGSDGEARGFILDGTVYLLADQLNTPRQTAEVLFHEVLGHYGLKGVFGKELTPILQQVGTMRRKEVLAKAREYGMVSKGMSDSATWAAMSEQDRVSAAEEVLAEMAQSTPEIGFVQRAIAAIRTWLRANVPGFKQLALTDAEIVRSYILPARGFVTRSSETPQQSLERAMMAFSRGNNGNRGPGTTDFDTIANSVLPSNARSDTGEVRSVYPDAAPSQAQGTTSGQINFSRTPAAAPATGWDAPVKTGFDDVIYKLQDKNIDLKRVVEAITKSAGQVADSIDAYMKEELFHKRAAKRVADFGTQELRPLMNQMRMAGLSMDDVQEYLHARHAKEANAVIASRNPDSPGLQDGGSGMTNAAADNYFAKLDPAQRKKLEAVSKKVDDIIEGTRKLYVSYGLEDQAVVDGWSSMYQHYIPLMREDKDGGMGTGQGFSVKGKETKGRTGSTRKVVDILANIATQREKLIVRGEKNQVTQALVGLAQANPNSEFWEVRSQAPTERVFDPKKAVVVDRPDPLFKSRDNVIVAKVLDSKGNVTEQMVVFNEDNPRAMRMAAAMKNLDAGDLEGLLGVSAKITRYFAAINTQYNPVFGVVNLVRDVPGAMINLAATPLAGQQGKIARDTASALIGIYSDIRKTRRGGAATSKWAQLWEQMQDDGGTTGYRDLFTNSTDRANDLKSILNPEGWMDNKWGKVFTANGALRVPMSMAQKGATEIFGWLSDYNEAMENGVRLAAYKAALDMGMSRERAASIAKNLTVNFNRKGQVGQQAGAVYAFFNAAMQGTARLGQTLFDMDGGDFSTLRLSKTGKAVVYGGVLLGVMQALALAGAGFDDEDPPEFVRERSLIIPTGNKTYVSIPMPLGLHVIPGLGRQATEFALSGFDKPAKRALSVVGMFADAFNPIGNAGLSMQTLAPTALDPLVALTENKDWTGKPIARVSSNKALPGHTQWKDTATAPAKMLAEAINWVSGGNEYVAGALSPTPDQIDYLLAQLGGGVAREAAKVQQTVSSVVSGEELPTYKVPLLGRFAGNTASQASQGTAFYANLDKLNALETEIKGLRKDGRFLEAAQLARENPQSGLIVLANRAERDVQKLRRDKRELIATGATREQVRAKEEQITAVMVRLNEAAERRKAAATG